MHLAHTHHIHFKLERRQQTESTRVSKILAIRLLKLKFKEGQTFFCVQICVSYHVFHIIS